VGWARAGRLAALHGTRTTDPETAQGLRLATRCSAAALLAAWLLGCWLLAAGYGPALVRADEKRSADTRCH
jgi:hypothetical protein